MSTIQLFTVINILGGISVLASYVIGLTLYPEHRDALWGGITGGLRTLFVISMLLAAPGYLTFSYFVIFKSGTLIYTQISAIKPYMVHLTFAIFIISASIWMPSTITYLNTSNVVWWWITVATLWITGLSLVILVLTVSQTQFDGTNLIKTSAFAGLTYMTFHCLVLDAIIWVIRFNR